MKKHFTFILLISLLFSCKVKKEEIKYITYKIDIEITNDTLDKVVSNYLLQKYGDSLQIMFDNKGNINFKYYGSGDFGYDVNIYNIKENNFYAKWKNIDTAYYYNVNKNILDLIEKNHLESQEVNEVICNVIEFKGLDSYSRDTINQIFYYNKNYLAIDCEKYKSFKEFFFYDYDSIS